jgi:hypothetical protein
MFGLPLAMGVVVEPLAVLGGVVVVFLLDDFELLHAAASSTIATTPAVTRVERRVSIGSF